jgi:2,4-dienoyl-CoA reductase-like NADH-dependent reductase (Old Yellow Enzyme family)
MGVHTDAMMEGLQQMTTAVHRAGGRIVLQLAHAGCQAAVKLTGQDAIGPSPLKDAQGLKGRSMSEAEITATIEAFGDAAHRAYQAGFDGVQIHAAHGYLISQFLSPYFNHRQDHYGGSPENRQRLVREVLARIRQAVGPNYPVLIKLNSEDFLDGGLDLDAMLAVADSLERAGIDAIELSGGTALSGNFMPVRRGRIDTAEKEVFYRTAAGRFKVTIGVPLILVGGIRSFEVAEAVIADGMADYIALSRPLICEPELVQRWQNGDLRRSACRSDNLCFTPVGKGKGVYCVTAERRAKQKQTTT